MSDHDLIIPGFSWAEHGYLRLGEPVICARCGREDTFSGPCGMVVKRNGQWVSCGGGFYPRDVVRAFQDRVRLQHLRAYGGGAD